MVLARYFLTLFCCCIVLASAYVALATEDAAAPALTAFSRTPTSVNTTSAAQTITWTMTITDALSGFSSGILTLYPGGTTSAVAPGQTHVCSFGSAQRTSGDAYSGVYSVPCSMPRYSAVGTWQTFVSITDAIGNTKGGVGWRGGSSTAGMAGFDSYSSASRITVTE